MKSYLSLAPVRRLHFPRRALALAAIVALFVTLPVTVPDAAAGHDRDSGLYFAAGIRLGGFHVSIGYDGGRYGRHGGDYYYRTRDRIHYDGYQCGDRCYRRGRDYYHHQRCPVMLHLLHVERIHPHRLFLHHAPSYGGHWASYDPYDWHRSYRGSRYGYDDRRGRHRGYYDDDSDSDRYHRRHRGRGHHRGHHRYCRH